MTLLILVSIPKIKLLWTYETKGSIKSSPAVADLDGDGTHEIIFGSEDKRLYALTNDGKKLWTYETKGSIKSSPAVADLDGDGTQEIIFGSEDGNLYVLNAKGKEKWKYKTNGKITSSPVIADFGGNNDSEIIFGSWDKNIYVLNSKGDLIFHLETLESIESSPVIADINKDGRLDIICGSNDNRVYVIDPPSDGQPFKRVGTYLAGGDITASPAIVQSKGSAYPKIVIGSTDGEISVLSFNERKEEKKEYKSRRYWTTSYVIYTKLAKSWDYKTDGEIISSPAVADLDGDGNLEIVVGSEDRNLYIFDANGNRLVKYTTNDKIISSPAIADLEGDEFQEIITASFDGNIYVLNTFGSRKWSYKIPGKITSSPAVADINGDGTHEIIIGSWDNKIYVFGAEKEIGEEGKKLKKKLQRINQSQTNSSGNLNKKDKSTTYSSPMSQRKGRNGSHEILDNEISNSGEGDDNKDFERISIGMVISKSVELVGIGEKHDRGVMMLAIILFGMFIVYFSYRKGVSEGIQEAGMDEILIDQILEERGKGAAMKSLSGR
jgi:WD40 repeat protein